MSTMTAPSTSATTGFNTFAGPNMNQCNMPAGNVPFSLFSGGGGNIFNQQYGGANTQPQWTNPQSTNPLSYGWGNFNNTFVQQQMAGGNPYQQVAGGNPYQQMVGGNPYQ
jgi:hypothetical protein